MKKKELKALLKNSIETKVPSCLETFDITSIHVEPKTKKAILMQPKLVLRFSFVLILAFLLTIGLLNSNETTNPSPSITLSTEKTTSFNAITSSVLLDSIDSEPTLSNELSVLYSFETLRNETVMSNKINDLNPYFNLIELVINEDDTFDFSEPLVSDVETYEYMMDYQTFSLANEPVKYTYYYRQSNISGENVTEGMVLVGDKQFYMDTTIKEDEDTLTVETYTYDRLELKGISYVYTKCTETNKAQKFTYQLFKNSEKVEETSLELKSLNKHMIVELDYENLLSNTEIKLEARRRLQLDGAILDVKYELENSNGDEEGTMMVKVVFDETLGNYQFHYEIKNRKGDQSEHFGNRYGQKKEDSDDDEENGHKEDHEDDERGQKD
ncbi:MAG: hypothetical protein RBQ91_00280 [Acholeplasma sp.]|nr:hypothetical protein [Acholeplasma sp.]